jgi:hypothetical protein
MTNDPIRFFIFVGTPHMVGITNNMVDLDVNGLVSGQPRHLSFYKIVLLRVIGVVVGR